MLPRPGRGHNDVLRIEPDMSVPWPSGGGCEDTDGAIRWAPDTAAALFFSDCPPELAMWAANQRRGQYWKITEQVTPRHAWPDVPVTSVIGTAGPDG